MPPQPQKKGFFPNGPFQLKPQVGMLPLSQPRPKTSPSDQPQCSAPAAMSPERRGHGVDKVAQHPEQVLPAATAYPAYPYYTTPQGYGPPSYGNDYTAPYNTMGTSAPHLNPMNGGQAFAQGLGQATTVMPDFENTPPMPAPLYSSYVPSHGDTARVKPPRGARGGAGKKKKHGNQHGYDTSFFQPSGQTASGASTVRHPPLPAPAGQGPGNQQPLSAAAPAFVPPQSLPQNVPQNPQASAPPPTGLQGPYHPYIPQPFNSLAIHIHGRSELPSDRKPKAYYYFEHAFYPAGEVARPLFPELLSHAAREGGQPTLIEGVKPGDLNYWHGKSRVWRESRPMLPTPYSQITELELKQVQQMKEDGAASALSSYMHVVGYGDEDKNFDDEVAVREWEQVTGLVGRRVGPKKIVQDADRDMEAALQKWEIAAGVAVRVKGPNKYGAVGDMPKNYGAVGDGRSSHSSKGSQGDGKGEDKQGEEKDGEPKEEHGKAKGAGNEGLEVSS